MNSETFQNKQLLTVLGDLGIADRTFFVGGAVRDNLLGRNVKDIDLVVQNLTSADVERISAAFPMVGKGFPVWLLEVGNETFELAATRIERSVGVGHTDFETNFIGVPLSDDLVRRDLTINALARPVTDPCTLVDGFDGVGDLAKGRLRHVSEAFAEDPLRVYRVARFAALYGFRVDVDTLDLMRYMNYYTTDLPGERVYEEVAKVLRTGDANVIRTFFDILYNTGNDHWFPEIDIIALNFLGNFDQRFSPEVYYAGLFRETECSIVFPAEWTFCREISGNVLTALENDNVGKLFALATVVVRKRSRDVELNILHVLNTKNVAWRFQAYLDVVKQPLPQRLIDSFPGKNKVEIWDIKVEWWRSIIANPSIH